MSRESRKDKACLLVVIGAMSDGRKEVLALVPGYRESTESWLEVLRDLRDRGLHHPILMVADGNMGHLVSYRSGLATHPPAAMLEPQNPQRAGPDHKRQQPKARALLLKIPHANTFKEADKGSAESSSRSIETSSPRPRARSVKPRTKSCTIFNTLDGNRHQIGIRRQSAMDLCPGGTKLGLEINAMGLTPLNFSFLSLFKGNYILDTTNKMSYCWTSTNLRKFA